MLLNSYKDIRLLLAYQEQSNEAVTVSNRIPVEVLEEKYKDYVNQLKLNKKRVIVLEKESKGKIVQVKVDLTRKLKRTTNSLLPKIREKYSETFSSGDLMLDLGITKDVVNNVINVLLYYKLIKKVTNNHKKLYQCCENTRFNYVN